MDPIEIRADANFHQALLCVEYRRIHSAGLKPAGYTVATALRYGLVGSAAANNLLLTSHEEILSGLKGGIEHWRRLVEEHVATTMSRDAPFDNPNAPALIGSIASAQMKSFLILYRRGVGFAECLAILGQLALSEHKGMIGEGFPWYRRRQATRRFRITVMESTRFAINFLERRQVDLDEVPEIALLGE